MGYPVVIGNYYYAITEEEWAALNDFGLLQYINVPASFTYTDNTDPNNPVTYHIVAQEDILEDAANFNYPYYTFSVAVFSSSMQASITAP